MRRLQYKNKKADEKAKDKLQFAAWIDKNLHKKLHNYMIEHEVGTNREFLEAVIRKLPEKTN